MSHITVIISRSQSFNETESQERELSYTYEIPIPHGTTPQQVGELVRKAFKRLEDAGD